MESIADDENVEPSDYEMLFERLREKLNPNLFPDMNPRFVIIVRAILGPQRDLYMDKDGSIFDDEGKFLGTRLWLTECWGKFIVSAKAGLTTEEHQEAQGFLRCFLNYCRCEAPDKKPYMEKFAQAITLAYKVTDNPKEIATLVADIMSPKDRNAKYN